MHNAKAAAIDSFVNNNAHNVSMLHNNSTAHDLFDTLVAYFAQLFAHTTVDESAFPVLVFEQDSSAVAWYDCENCVGFIQHTA